MAYFICDNMITLPNYNICNYYIFYLPILGDQGLLCLGTHEELCSSTDSLRCSALVLVGLSYIVPH